MIAYTDPFLGKIIAPAEWHRAISAPGHPTRRPIPHQIGLYVGMVRRKRDWESPDSPWDIVWVGRFHNERVDAGAAKQAGQLHGGGSTPAAPDATNYFRAIAIANATLTLTKTDQSLGSASSGVTTNEFTTLGLSRALATAPVGGDYTLPGALGGQFAQILRSTMTATGNATAFGAGVFDRTAVASSILYGEGNYASQAVMVNNDQLTTTVTNNN